MWKCSSVVEGSLWSESSTSNVGRLLQGVTGTISTRGLWAQRTRRLGNDAAIHPRKCHGFCVQIPRDLFEGSRPLHSGSGRPLCPCTRARYPATGRTARPSKFSQGGDVCWTRRRSNYAGCWPRHAQSYTTEAEVGQFSKFACIDEKQWRCRCIGKWRSWANGIRDYKSPDAHEIRIWETTHRKSLFHLLKN